MIGVSMRQNIDIARDLIKKAQEFNFFGATNINGSRFSSDLRKKYKEWKQDDSIEFTLKELKLLKPVIAQCMVYEEMIKYSLYRPIDNLSIHEKIKRRTIRSLNIAKTLAKCGSFNCEIAHIVVYLALVQKISIPIELITFSGVREEGKDTKHYFVTVGATDTSLFSTMIKRKQNEHKHNDYILCDPHHSEVYPVTQALTESNQRLARYDDISHSKLATVRRFLYINNPEELHKDKEISELCEEVLKNKNDTSLKREVEKIFNEIKQKSGIKASIQSLVAMKRSKKEEPVEIKVSIELIINRLTDILKLQKNLTLKKKESNQVWNFDHFAQTLKLSGLLFPNESSVFFCIHKLEKNGFIQGKDFNFIEVQNGHKTSSMLCILNLNHSSLQSNNQTTVAGCVS
jgi:hypothetical protein